MLRAAGPGTEADLQVHLPGAFNVANGLGALAILASAGVDVAAAASGISSCPGVPGRMERVPDPHPERDVFGYVDYAHTPDAVERALAAGREVARAGGDRRVVVVLGAGGDRDPHKRAAMGQAAVQGADRVIVTDDNPRSEDPAAIRAEILRGARTAHGSQVVEVGDRRAAIRRAVAEARRGDVVLILGKGHEQGQEVAGTVTPFDDRAVLAEALAEAPADAVAAPAATDRTTPEDDA